MTSHPCLHCTLPTPNRRECNACEVAKRRGRLAQRLERLRELGRRGRVKAKVERVAPPSLRPGVQVRLLWQPEEQGRILRAERDGWVVWVQGWGQMKVMPGEMRVEERR